MHFLLYRNVRSHSIVVHSKLSNLSCLLVLLYDNCSLFIILVKEGLTLGELQMYATRMQLFIDTSTALFTAIQTGYREYISNESGFCKMASEPLERLVRCSGIDKIDTPEG